MGGNALSVASVRLTRKNYARLAEDCEARLRSAFPGLRVEVVDTYRGKADFGDCDILVQKGAGWDVQRAADVLGAVEVVRNGPVTSLGLVVRESLGAVDGNVFQVDLIEIAEESFDFAAKYFGRGDAGNLLGRLFHACGLALRHDGLVYYVRDGDYKFDEILLSRDFGQALAFMGHEPQPYADGFDSVEDIFRYVASSPFFNSDIFLLNNRNAKARTRDNKRPIYNEFLRWCEGRSDLPAFSYPKDKSVWRRRIAEYFPRFRVELDWALARLEEQRAVKAKFNGAWVSSITGLQGKDLGALMRSFKESFETPAEMHAFTLNSSQQEIGERVLALQAEMQGLPSKI